MFKTLYLIRHAKSSWANPSMKDHDRPLNKRGIHDIPVMGKRMHNRGERLEMFLSSTSLRTRLTAEGIAKEINFPVNKINYNSDLFHASPKSILGTIQKTASEIHSIAICAHNPGITLLANHLGYSVENVPTCGILKFQIQSNDWNIQVNVSKTKMEYFDYPKKQQ